MFADAEVLEETTCCVVDVSRMRVIRTGIVAGVTAAVVLAGFWYLSIDQKQQQIEALKARNDAFQETIQQREAMLQRLTRSQRSGLLEVLEQTTDAAGLPFTTTVRFIELDGEGRSIGSQVCTVQGNVIFLDGLVVKFDHAAVAAGDPLKGRSLVLFRRIYSDQMSPSSGIMIDTPGAVPPGYAVGEIGAFEQEVWRAFWEVATDAALAQRMGIRVAQGEAVYKPVTVGDVYEVTIDAVGGLNLIPTHRRAPLVSQARD
jgi:hypothetical protein